MFPAVRTYENVVAVSVIICWVHVIDLFIAVRILSYNISEKCVCNSTLSVINKFQLNVEQLFIFMYLFDCFFPTVLKNIHLHGGDQHYGGRKPGSALGKPMTIRRSLEDLPTYCRRESALTRLELTAPVLVRGSWDIAPRPSHRGFRHCL